MNQEIKEKWVAALRSGEYTQTHEVLRNNEGFCCLGVVCDIFAKEGNGVWEDEYDFRYKDDIDDKNLPISLSDDIELTTQEETILINLNDEEGNNFNQIADYLETL